jgi:hypothetical protein
MLIAASSANSCAHSNYVVLSSTQPQCRPGACHRLALAGCLQARCTAPRGGGSLSGSPCKPAAVRAGGPPPEGSLHSALASAYTLLELRGYSHALTVQGGARALQVEGAAGQRFRVRAVRMAPAVASAGACVGPGVGAGLR